MTFTEEDRDLHRMCIKNDLRRVKKLVARGVDPSKPDPLYHGDTALHTAIRFNSGDVATWLIEVLRVDINSKNFLGETPLVKAAFFNRVEAIEYLLNKGANPKITFNYARKKSEPIDVLPVEAVLMNAETHPADKTAALKLFHKREILLPRDSNVALRAVFLALRDSTDPEFREDFLNLMDAIFAAGLSPDCRNFVGVPFVCQAAGYGNRRAIEIAHKHGADVNLQTLTKGFNALHEVAFVGRDPEMVPFLMDLGVDPTTKSFSDITPPQDADKTPLQLSTALGNFSVATAIRKYEQEATQTLAGPRR